MPRVSILSLPPVNITLAITCTSLTTSKKTNAGNRLYRYWAFIYALNGKRREMMLGSVEVMSLNEARRKALEARIMLNDGVDPLVERAATRRATVAVPSFGEFADEYVVLHRPRFRNDKHAAQWKTTLGDAYCKAIRSRPVSAIDTEAVLTVLQPVWTQVPETASRLRGRIENVLDAAKVRGSPIETASGFMACGKMWPWRLTKRKIGPCAILA